MSDFEGTIEDFEGRYEGERLFIIGNGPSLNETPLEELESEYTLAMSKISLIYPDREWRPSFYYFALPPDHEVTPDEKEIITRNVNMDIRCFLHSSWSDILGERNNTFYFDRWALHGSPFGKLNIEDVKKMPVDHLQEFWSDDVSNLVYHYHTMYGAMQTAVYMGFDEIYLLGCDMGQEYKNPHMVFESGLDPYRHGGSKNKVTLKSYLPEALDKGNLIQSIVNLIAMKAVLAFQDSRLEKILDTSTGDHFTSDYLDHAAIIDGVTNDREILKGHIVTKKICDEKGVDVYNATMGGELEVYDRVDLSDIISTKKNRIKSK